MTSLSVPRQLRTLFLSDLHLGAKASRADAVLDFLDHHRAERICLVGDVIDATRLTANWNWPERHNDVVRRLIELANSGVDITYLGGNHDNFIRQYIGKRFGNITITDRAIHECADGRRFLIIHGDQFDHLVCKGRFYSVFGDIGYQTLLKIDEMGRRLAMSFGARNWSILEAFNSRFKSELPLVRLYEKTLSDAALNEELDGVVCGHIHHPTLHSLYGVEYANCGDWVENCTGLAETFDGALELIEWR